MVNLDIDVKSLLPHIIDAFSKIYGEEYTSIISKKLNKAAVIQYHSTLGLDSYINFIKTCKAREFSIRFLSEIGIDVQKYKTNNYTKSLDDNVRIILDYLIDSTLGFSEKADLWSPLRAFNQDNKNDPAILLHNKIRLINYLLNDESMQVNEDNFEKFTHTEKYSEILNKIKDLNVVYDKLYSEYLKWTKQLEVYEQYVRDEYARRKNILQKKTEELYNECFNYLPEELKNALSNKPLKEQIDIILGEFNISSEFNIEFFHSKEIEKLKSSETSYYDKYFIINNQIKYLNNFGINIQPLNMSNFDEEIVNNHLAILNRDDIKKYIPSDEIIDLMTSHKEGKYEEALKEYYTTRQDFINIMNFMGHSSDNINFICKKMKDKLVCIEPGTINIDGKTEFAGIMFYTIRDAEAGMLDYILMHEYGHIIDQSEKGCGFETDIYTDLDNVPRNAYDNKFRKYEKFNETLNDMFTLEALDILREKGIYLIEPQEFTKEKDILIKKNTHSFTKNLLAPLIQRFRKQVIKAKINTDPEELITYIGKDNFEELVDAVNQVDYLTRNVEPLDNEYETVEQICMDQIERVKQIYINIDNYYTSKFKNTLENNEIDENIQKR